MNKATVAQQAKTASLLPPAQGLLQRQCACGNHKVAGGECAECAKNQSGLHRKLAFGENNDPLEQEANRVAEQVMASSAHHAVTGVPSRIQRLSKQSDGQIDVVPASVKQALGGSGRPLERPLRQDMEQRFGHDFSQVRVHTDATAGQSARDVHANAYTVGHHIVFDSGQFATGTHEGRRLIAHELTHVVQQSSNPSGMTSTSLRVSQPGDAAEREADGMAGQVSAGTFMQVPATIIPQRSSGVIVQRQESTQPPAITAKTIFPYPEKSRVLISRLLADKWLNMATGEAEDENDKLALRLLSASEGKIATVMTASDDLFELVLPDIELAKEGNSPATTVKDVRLTLKRQTDGKFAFELTAGGKSLFIKRNLKATRSGQDLELEPPKGPTAIIHPGDKSDQLQISGAMDLEGIPFQIEALKLTRLPDVPAGSEAEKKIVRQVAQEAKAVRREPRFELTFGAGALSGAKWDPVFAASWRVSLQPFSKTGGLLSLMQVPLRMDIEYAPDKTLLAGISTGGEFALPTKIPVNVRVVGGWAGGKVAGEVDKSSLLPAYGPTIGAGVGIGGKTFRMEFDYQHLQNLAHSSPNVDSFILSGGVRF